MKIIELEPSEIITLNDYPVYSLNEVDKYYRKCLRGEELPLVPVLHAKVVIKYFGPELRGRFEKFEIKNPMAKYFMIDGNHRTVAVTLTDKKVKVVVYEKDEDIDEAKKLVATGKILENGTLDYDLIRNCEILNKHFMNKAYFMTVAQKTEKLVKEGFVDFAVKSF